MIMTALLLIGLLLAALRQKGALVGNARAIAALAPSADTGKHPQLDKVHPTLAAKILQVIALAAKDGYRLTVTQGLRTIDEQNALYAQGRTRSGPIVTNARGGFSWHNFGLAVDLAYMDESGKPSWDEKRFNYRLFGKWGAAVGLEWGGNWKKFRDQPHFQMIGRLTTAQARATMKQGGLPAVWQLVQ